MNDKLTAMPFIQQPRFHFAGDIGFVHNYNGKTRCRFFTTIRLCNNAKYRVGSFYRIIVNNDYKIDAKIIAIRNCKIDQLPEFTCYQDTGFDKETTIAMIANMYSGRAIDWDTQQLSIILLENMDFQIPLP